MTSAPAASSRAVSLARNALTGGGRFAVSAVLALAVTPFALAVLGDDRFGLWALAGALLSMVRLLDLGLGRSMTRAVATANGQGRATTSLPALATGRAILIAVGLLGVAAVWVLRDTLVASVLHVPPELWSEARYVLLGAAVVGGVEGLFAPARAALDGLGRMDLSNGVDTGQRIVSALGVFVVLGAGWGLEGLVWKNLLTAVLAGAAYHLVLRYRARDLSGFELSLDGDLARSLVSYGRHIQAVNLSGVAMEVGVKLVLSRVVGLPAVAAYEIASRVTGQVAGALLAAATAVFPAAAEIRSAAGERADDELARLQGRAAKYLSWLALPSYLLLAALSSRFVSAWLGAGYEAVAASIAGLSIGWLIAVLATPAHMVSQAGGRVRLSTIAATITVGVALAGAVVLARPMGLAGVVAGVALGLATGAVAMWGLFARSFGCGWRELGFVRARPMLAAIISVALALALASILPATLLGVAVAAAMGVAAYGALLLVTGEMGGREIALARALFRR